MIEIAKECPAYSVSIWVAGDAIEAERICRRFCMGVGLCVTVTPTNYVYTGGAELGVHVRLVNYPRFPSVPEEIDDKASRLARELRDGLHQTSVLIETPNIMKWLTTRVV